MAIHSRKPMSPPEPEPVPFKMEDAEDPIHYWFGLSYSNYLVLPRSLMQSMPREWQAGMVGLLRQMHDHFGSVTPNYRVNAIDDGGRFVKDDLADYQRGRRRLPPKDTPAQE